MPAPLAAAAAPLVKGLLGGLGRGALMGGRSALMTGVRAGAKGGLRQGIRSGVRQGARNTMRGGGVGGRGGGNRGGGLVKQTNDSAITRSENGGLAVQGRTIKEGGALTPSVGPTSQKSSAIVKTGPTKDNVLGLLEQIKQTADQILEVEVKELDNDNKEYKDTKKDQEKERKLLESQKRDEEENKQEEKKAKKGRKKKNPVVSAAKKGLGNIFDFLMGIFKDFVLYKVLDWVSDPKNKEKVTQLVKFIGAIPGALKFMWKNFVEPWWEFSKKLFGGGFKIFMSLFNVVKDVIELKWLTNPGEFFNTLMEVPKTLIEVVPGILGSLLDAITGGAITKIGDLVSGLFNNPLRGIDLGNVGSLLGSAAGFVKGLLGNAWTGITNAVGNIFGGGGTPSTPKNMQNGGRAKSSKSGAKSTPKPDKPSQPPATKPITKTSGTADLGDKNYGVKVNAAKAVELDGVTYIFTRKKDGWSVTTRKEVATRRGKKNKTVRVDATKVEGLVQAFDKEHGGMSDPTGRGTDPPAAAPTGSGGNPYDMVVTSSAMQNRSLAISSGMHMGVDIANGKSGAPLQAFTDGTITGTGVPSAGYGNWVSWTDTAGLEHFYAHMERPTPFKVGDKVQSGTKLGTVGNTGNSAGAHLHWEVSTTPGDTGRSKASVLSRINPLSKYAFTAPFGGSTAPAAGSATTPPPSAKPEMRSSPPKTGSNLGSAQQESRSLSSGGSKKSSPTVINNSTSTQATQKASETAVGGTLPTSGLWAIYSFAI